MFSPQFPIAMLSASHLEELLWQVRSDTLRLLQAAPAPMLTWVPAGTSNHLLWHAGHALWLQDALAVKPITGRSELPRGWGAVFGMDSRPAAVQDWPDRDEVGRLLSVQRQRLLDLLRALPAEALQHHAPETERRRALVPGIIHGLHDEAKHQGEMYLLLKLYRAGGSVFT